MRRTAHLSKLSGSPSLLDYLSYEGFLRLSAREAPTRRLRGLSKWVLKGGLSRLASTIQGMYSTISICLLRPSWGSIMVMSGYIGIMENEMETIYGLGFRV